MGAECCVPPQDPAKARWLTGSGALLSGLLVFLLLPPLLFSHMEGWSYVEGFYFAFITLSTVGFGDYVIGESPGGQRGGGGLRLAAWPSTPCPFGRLPWVPAAHQARWGPDAPSPWWVKPTFTV